MSGPVIVAGVRPALTVEQQLRRDVRELVEALTEIADVKALGDAVTALDYVREHAREAIAKHKGAA